VIWEAGKTGYGCGKALDNLALLEREYHEAANFANFLEFIRVICIFVYFALKNFMTLLQP
jgi:hypothetical protein